MRNRGNFKCIKASCLIWAVSWWILPPRYLVDRICNEEIEEQVYDLTFGSEEWKQLDAGLVSRFDGNQAMLRNAKRRARV